MQIELPATLNAEYESKSAQEYPFEQPGHVIIKFGRVEIARVAVTQQEHDELDAVGFYSAHETRERALEEFVVRWLQARWGL